LRIIAGRHRGRRIGAPPDRSIRPTADKTRQAVFNILEHGSWLPAGIEGLDVLDAFAGTGAMGLEALSRGAAHVVFLENHPDACRLIRRNVAALGEGPRATLVERSALRPGRRAAAPAALAFLDPPYGEGLAAPALAALAKGGWFAAGAIVAVETGGREELAPPEGFERLDERRYGAARVTFLRVGMTPTYPGSS
jgi:16S rRNA (guanine966-N2)-methyltransferase